ncbi:MAG: hypothetical protein V4542_16110 [Pseudomonadota bacterium]
MLQLPIGRLFSAFQRLSVTGQVLKMHLPKQASMTMPDQDFIELQEAAKEFSDLCLDSSLLVTHEAAKRVCSDLQRANKNQDGSWTLDFSASLRTSNALDQLVGCLRHEATTKAAMILPPDKLHLYAPSTPIYGLNIRSKFPSATYDIDEASKCVALGRSTAAVFHLMRVIEVSLKAIAKHLGAKQPNNPNWGSWLVEINREIEKRSPVGSKKWVDNDFFQDVYHRLDAIKDAQRNPTLHTETVHTEGEALLIFQVTEAFMQKIASKMDQDGLPLAP